MIGSPFAAGYAGARCEHTKQSLPGILVMDHGPLPSSSPIYAAPLCLWEKILLSNFALAKVLVCVHVLGPKLHN